VDQNHGSKENQWNYGNQVKNNCFERDGSKIRVLALFSGCGGMDFGIEAAGGHIIFANDAMHDACATHQKYFSESDLASEDILKIKNFPDADIVVGGYPCQSFSMAGNRTPQLDKRTNLYKEFLRVIRSVRPRYFMAENVSGLKHLKSGSFLQEQIDAYSIEGYATSYQMLNAKDYGVPQSRKRLFIVGIRKDLNQEFSFPPPTHGKSKDEKSDLEPYMSHGDAISGLPLWPEGDFYERLHDPEGHFSWYFMSRNRKPNWDGPAYTVVANWRHVTLHPASPSMKLTWSNLADGWKQRWDFSEDYDHVYAHPNRPKLAKPRRLSWRECALIQTFPDGFEPEGDMASKFTQIGNAVPPLLAEVIFRHLFTGVGLSQAAK
jgi:DNA (cytosine-5)-methyltransferase 1